MVKQGDKMKGYVLTVGNNVYYYDNEKAARKAFHLSVVKNGLNNVRITVC